MKLLTFYTDSHKKLYESYFLPSFEKHLKDDFELLVGNYEQICADGSYGTSGFGQTMLGKLEHIIRNIDLNDDEPMVFADCDIQFFDNIKDDIINELGDYDIKFQNDLVCICAGFFICKQNEQMLAFFKDVESTLRVDQNTDDQQLMNKFLSEKKHDIKAGVLTKEKYYTVVVSTGAKQWNGEEFNVPNTVLMHHGNWTVGLDNKFKLLEYVKNNR